MFYDVAFCFVYLTFILTLPVSMPIPLYLLFSFITAMFIDMAYDMIGVHIAATVLTAYLRSYIIAFLTPLGGYPDNMQPTIQSNGFQWFATYVFILTTLHHAALFFLEAFGFSHIGWTLAKIFCSALFTSFIITAIQYIFFTPFRTSGRKR
ncbi:MAG: hypothetical protein NW207_06000 [Cytophagales bacterium]|nr:hypothetical protein [Cytophagales bacterium]